MEHIVNFGISFDDETLVKRIKENAYSDIIKNLMNDAKDCLPTNYYNRNRIDWAKLAESSIEKIIKENKQEIIDVAAEKLAESFKRTKAYKEKMKEVIEEV